jgi:hypothetical protein
LLDAHELTLKTIALSTALSEVVDDTFANFRMMSIRALQQMRATALHKHNGIRFAHATSLQRPMPGYAPHLTGW